MQFFDEKEEGNGIVTGVENPKKLPMFSLTYCFVKNTLGNFAEASFPK